MNKGINNPGFRSLPQSVQQNILSNMKYGGRMYDNGGMLTEYNEGGTHEENPLGGIPVGQGPNGEPNLVEEGETRFGDYIFSDRLEITKDIAQEFNLPKNYVGKTFSDASKSMQKSNSRRINDKIEQANIERNLTKLQEAQEMFKQAEIAKKLEEINELDPNALAAIAGQGQGQPSMAPTQPSPEEMMMMEQAAMQQGQMAEQPMMEGSMEGMAYGGPLSNIAFGGGGSMNFKSPAAYKAWLGYGHASGAFDRTPGNQKVSIQGEPHRVQHAMGGHCYGCGGRMYASGGQFVPGRGFVLSEDNSDNLLGAGIVGGLKGATAMIPGVGGYVSQGIDAIYKGIDPTLSDAEKRAMGYTQGVTSLSGLVTGNVPGAISNSIEGFNQGIQNTESISDETKNILGSVATVANTITPFLGQPGMPLGKNTPINVIDETGYIDLPDTFAMGGTMGKSLSDYYDVDGMGGYLGSRNFFSNGGDINPPNKYLVRTNQNGDLIEETYKIGDLQFINVKKITDPSLTEMDILQKYEEVTGKDLNATKPNEPTTQPENVSIDLPDDLNAPAPTPAVNTDSEIPELNTGEDLTEEQKQKARENYAKKQALDMAKINLKYKESLPAFALSMAPSMYNLYQGLSRPDQMNLNDIYSGDINPELVNYATSRNIMRDTAAGLKKDIKSKTQGGTYLANIQSTANKLSEGLSKIDELEQNTNAKIKSETDSLNKKRKDEANKIVTQYNKMADAAQAAHLNEALSSLKSKIETDAKNKFDLEKLRIFAPDVAGNLEYNTILDQLGSYTAGLFNKKKKI